MSNALLRFLSKKLKATRLKADMSTIDLETSLGIGEGWVDKFESLEELPTLDMLMAILQNLGVTPNVFFRDFPQRSQRIHRYITSTKSANGITVHFKYADYNAQYELPGATTAEFEAVIAELVKRLSSAAKSTNVNLKNEAVTNSFLMAVELWPHANPSDIWYFLIYRGFCDKFNHPAVDSRRSLEQSWKRTGGFALEEILVRHYHKGLSLRNINIFICKESDKKRQLAEQFVVEDRLEADKMDVFLSAHHGEREHVFGVIHVKASFAERRTDDVPMSRSLVEAGYCSPLWTMDCKSIPSRKPINRGELGDPKHGRRSAKRKDIEDDGYFSACFSYNSNTKPTLRLDSKARIIVCDFNNGQNDAFVNYIASEWDRYRVSRSMVD